MMRNDGHQSSAPIMTAAMRGGEATFKSARAWCNGSVYAAVKNWTGLDAELIHCRQQHTLVLTLSGGTDLTGTKISGAPIYEGTDRTGSVTFVPSGAERRGWYRNANLNFVVLLVAPDYIRNNDFSISAVDLKPFTNQRDPLIETVLSSLSAEMIATGPELPSLYAEHVAGLALSHVMRSAVRRSPSRPTESQLSDTRLPLVVDFIEANLHRDISLSELATLTGLVPDVFARHFRRRVGMPPYRYLLERRIRRAEILLRSSEMPIADIALEVGFSSQSHFTTQFRRISSTTPGAYRAQFRD